MANNTPTHICRLSVILLGTAVLLSACTTRTDIVARVTPGFAPTLVNPIAFSQSSFQTPEQLHLAEVVKAEFVRRGVEFVPSAKSEYVLGCWIEENQEQKKGRSMVIPSSDYSPRVSSPLPPGLSSGVYLPERGGSFMRTVEVPDHGGLYYIGIRMRLFVTHPKNSNIVETAWEGHIDAGARLSSDEYEPLVKALVDYFGRSYVGRVKLVE